MIVFLCLFEEDVVAAAADEVAAAAVVEDEVGVAEEVDDGVEDVVDCVARSEWIPATAEPAAPMKLFRELVVVVACPIAPVAPSSATATERRI